mmetsp:Transcript_25725/g.73463  ORF Transcript_25725/g.73463 Transcript_25725/m.73463 type:complete len:216 (+) Transcript_25725:250-897(+)
MTDSRRTTATVCRFWHATTCSCSSCSGLCARRRLRRLRLLPPFWHARWWICHGRFAASSAPSTSCECRLGNRSWSRTISSGSAPVCSESSFSYCGSFDSSSTWSYLWILWPPSRRPSSCSSRAAKSSRMHARTHRSRRRASYGTSCSGCRKTSCSTPSWASRRCSRNRESSRPGPWRSRRGTSDARWPSQSCAASSTTRMPRCPPRRSGTSSTRS